MKYIGENAIKRLIALIKGDLNKKLDKNQGIANYGKILSVNAGGEVAPTDTEVATLVDVPDGLLKGDGATISQAVAGTDYMNSNQAIRYDAAQTLTDAQKAQARANINAAAPDGYYGNSGGVYQYSTNFLGKNAPTVVKDLVFRPTASAMSGTAWSADSIGGDTATIERIKGKTLVWNQIMQNGNFASVSPWTDPSGHTIFVANNNILTGTITNQDPNSRLFTYTKLLKINHQYLLTCFIMPSVQQYVYIGFIKSTDLGSFAGKIPANVWTQVYSVYKKTSDDGYIPQINYNNMPAGETISFRNYCIFDLTQIFGAGNEPATVEEFRAMFPLDYYEYNPGELISFNGTLLQTTGFNQLKPDGTINVIGGMTYRIEGAYTSLVDSAGNAVTVTDNEFSPAQDDTYTMVGGSCVHLKWSGVRDGDTEDYWQRQLALPIATYFPDGMKSAGTVYDELTKDKAIKRVVSLRIYCKSYNNYNGDNGDFFCFASRYDTRMRITDAAFTYAENHMITGGLKYHIGLPQSYNGAVYVCGNCAILGYTIEEFNAFTRKEQEAKIGQYFEDNEVYLAYQLREPVITPISPELNLTYKVDDFGTEKLLPENIAEPVTTPMDADIVYQIDYEARVRNNDQINISKASMDNFIASFNASGLGTITQTYNPNTKQYEYTVTAPQPEPTEGGETV